MSSETEYPGNDYLSPVPEDLESVNRIDIRAHSFLEARKVYRSSELTKEDRAFLYSHAQQLKERVTGIMEEEFGVDIVGQKGWMVQVQYSTGFKDYTVDPYTRRDKLDGLIESLHEDLRAYEHVHGLEGHTALELQDHFGQTIKQYTEEGWTFPGQDELALEQNQVLRDGRTHTLGPIAPRQKRGRGFSLS